MPSPVLPDQICDTVPSSTASLCDRFIALLNLPRLLCQWFSWAYDSSGNPTAEFIGSVIPPGFILAHGGSAGTGWLECNGQAVSRTTYAELFTAIGTVWGVGDNVNTFNVPDFRGRTLIGDGTGSGLTARTLGSTLGEESHVLTEEELAAHGHGLLGDLYVNGNNRALHRVVIEDDLDTVDSRPESDPDGVQPTGDDVAHNNMQPSAVVKYYIKT